MIKIGNMKGGYIFDTDKFLNITSWNKGISLLTGITPEEAIGKKYYKVISRLKLNNVDAIASTIKDNRTIVFKDYPVSTTEGKLNADITISAIRDRKGTICGARVKVTHCFKYTEDFRKLSDFFETASLAHGLRGPLNTIKGVTQLLRDSRPGDNEIGDFTDLINESLEQMNTIISRFLNFPVKGLKKTNTDINTLLKSIKTLVDPLAVKNKIKTQYSYGDIPLIKADQLQIRQAVLNVIYNSIEATPKGGVLRITTGIEKLEGGNFTVISVFDTGPGIKSACRKGNIKNSRGFGLTLTRFILHCHGGWMNIDEDTEGTEIRLYLPIRKN